MAQHNHHCLVTFAGCDWRIVGCRKNEIDVQRWSFRVHHAIEATIDTRQVNWPAYCEAARLMDYGREAHG